MDPPAPGRRLRMEGHFRPSRRALKALIASRRSARSLRAQPLVLRRPVSLKALAPARASVYCQAAPRPSERLASVEQPPLLAKAQASAARLPRVALLALADLASSQAEVHAPPWRFSPHPGSKM